MVVLSYKEKIGPLKFTINEFCFRNNLALTGEILHLTRQAYVI